MPHARRPRRTLIAALLVGVTASVGSTALVPSTAVAADPLRYVALGDSYSSAAGVLPLVPTAPAACMQSTRNYPHVLAARLGAALTDVSCSAADTDDFAGSQYPGVPPQLDALRPDTQLVTMTIGGNDSNVFVGAIVQCGTLGVASLGQGSPCTQQYGDSFERTVRDTTYPALVAALTAVHQRSPQATVMIAGYPQILPPTGGCFPQMPVATGDVPYLRRLEATLNDAVSRAAAATGTTYVDLSVVSEGHDACQAIGTRWVEPAVGGTNPVIVHPNALGESKIAEQIFATLARTAPGSAAAAAVGGPKVATETVTKLGKARSASRRTLVVTVRSEGRRVPGVRVVLQRKPVASGGGRWRVVRKATTDDAGKARVAVRLRPDSVYRWKSTSTTVFAGSRSSRIRLPR